MMKAHVICLFALTVAALMVPAGCGGLSQSQFSPGQALRSAPAGAGGPSWIALTANADNLLYVANGATTSTPTVTLYSWGPGELLGALFGFTAPAALCVNKAQDVWVVDAGADDLIEYAHAGIVPIKTLNFPGSEPKGCSVDQTTGNLAAISDVGSRGVYVYAKAAGSPTQYTAPNFSYYGSIGYDGFGNLFVDGYDFSNAFVLAELPKGGSALQGIAVNQTLKAAGDIEWDGKYLAICDFAPVPNVVYQFSISGSNGSVRGATTLGGSGGIGEFKVPNFRTGNQQGTTIVGADFINNEISYWRYPAGGKAIKTITAGIKTPLGVAVSKATKP
jgi:hypothetical protein